MACGFSLSPASFQIFVFSSSQGRTVSLSIFCLFADISGLFWEGVAGDTAEFFSLGPSCFWERTTLVFRGVSRTFFSERWCALSGEGSCVSCFLLLRVVFFVDPVGHSL